MRKALREASVEATVPQPVDALVAQRCFAMEFLEGFKITDEHRLAKEGVDREALMAKLAHAYATQLLEVGLMNADPHPGIPLPSKCTRGAPVLH